MIFIRHKQLHITVAEPYFFANESIFWAIDISENQFSVYLHLFLLLFTLKMPLFKPFFLNIILTHVTKGLRILLFLIRKKSKSYYFILLAPTTVLLCYA